MAGRRPYLRLTDRIPTFEIPRRKVTEHTGLVFSFRPQEHEGIIMAEDKPMTVKERMAALARASSGGNSGA